MKIKNTKRFGYFLRKTAFEFKCFHLLIKNIFLLSKLNVKALSMPEQIAFGSHGRLTIFWDVTGCHKIKIKNIGVLSGDMSGVAINNINPAQPVEICFYGIRRRTKKTIRFRGAQIDFPVAFRAEATLPIAVETTVHTSNNPTNYFLHLSFASDFDSPVVQNSFADIRLKFPDFINQEN